MTHTWQLGHDQASPGHARRLVRGVLNQWQLEDDDADRVILTVSELVTNAVQHAKPPVTMQLCRNEATQTIRVDVADGGPCDEARNETKGPRCFAEHGRGLGIIDAISDAHGALSSSGCISHWAVLSVHC
ncbi:ATP-binding protein [Streptomyces sp. NPDC020490]|uniref:ATP-binding protein n=1 Tax=Streptomyces sp. NPDC020490 TaxID=3365078 RepID=UPI0037BAB558